MLNALWQRCLEGPFLLMLSFISGVLENREIRPGSTKPIPALIKSMKTIPEPVSHSYGHRSIPNWLASVIETAEYSRYSSRYMVSGAGHDCNYINQVEPTAMIFVPSKGGRGHFEVDYGFPREIMV